MTSAHVDSLIPLLALPDVARDELPEAERLEALAHVASCARCAAELAAFEETLGAVGVGLDGTAPLPVGRAHVLDAIAPEAPLERRIAGRRRRFQQVFDLDDAAYAELLQKALRDDEWLPVLPGMKMIPFAPGPKCAGGDASLIHFSAGARFPRHQHPGEEIMFFLEGGVRDDASGEEEHAGDALVMATGSAHSFTAFDDEDCLCGVLLYGGGPIFD